MATTIYGNAQALGGEPEYVQRFKEDVRALNVDISEDNIEVLTAYLIAIVSMENNRKRMLEAAHQMSLFPCDDNSLNLLERVCKPIDGVSADGRAYEVKLSPEQLEEKTVENYRKQRNLYEAMLKPGAIDLGNGLVATPVVKKESIPGGIDEAWPEPADTLYGILPDGEVITGKDATRPGDALRIDCSNLKRGCSCNTDKATAFCEDCKACMILNHPELPELRYIPVKYADGVPTPINKDEVNYDDDFE